MRLLSQIFQPAITIPRDAVIKNTEITCRSQKLLLECGLVRPTSAGFFALLPLAQRVMDKLEALVHQCMEQAGAQRIALPSLTAAKLWERTGRLQDVGIELLSVEDRHKKKYILSPTHEEAVADLLADVGPLSHRQLPILLYQIGSKFRDEPRPKHGLLRSREFTMMDAYGAHASAACAESTYERVTAAYRSLFRTLQLPVYRVAAPCGAMGGTLSHEWQLAADAGEDRLDACPGCREAERAPPAAAPDARRACPACGAETQRTSSVEVGHTFVLGARYGAALGAHCTTRDAAPVPLHMSCYGVGITRLLAASVEALSNERALRWPQAIAPYKLLIIGPKEGSREWRAHGPEQVAALGELAARGALRGEVLLDDTHHHTIGRRMKAADRRSQHSMDVSPPPPRLGCPAVVVCGRSVAEQPPRYELHRCARVGYSAPQLLTRAELLAALQPEAGERARPLAAEG